MKIGKSALIAATIASMGLSGSVVVATSAIGADNQKQNERVSKANPITKNTLKQTKANRLTSAYRYPKDYWLIPVNKESFKQARRKQLKLRSIKKAKKRGQV